VAAVDADGRVVHVDRLGTGFGADEVLANASSLAERTAAALGGHAREFRSVGVGIPGAVDPASGRVRHAVNLGIDDLELGAELGARIGCPVTIENDVTAAAFGAFHALGLPADHSLAYLNLGTGLAAGLVLRGQPWRGARGSAGEIGHIPDEPHGPVCACGQRGCVELSASGSGVARLWPSPPGRALPDLIAAAASGDSEALRVERIWSTAVASTIRALILTVDVDTVVIGGGLSALGDTLLVQLGGVFAEWALHSPFIASLDLPDRVSLLPGDLPAAALGAALLGSPA
jgi:glucokinase